MKKLPVFTVHRKEVEDVNLSYEALGVWIYMQSLPDDWKFSVTDLQRGAYDAALIESILEELTEAGYTWHFEETS